MSAAITTTATTLPAQALEVLAALQVAEKTATLDNLSMTPSVEDNTVTVTLTLPVNFSYVGGKISFEATDYLVP